MRLVVLAAICFLACGFLVFVLVEWVLDASRRTGVHSAGRREGVEKLD
jgi:hypothetical protein